MAVLHCITTNSVIKMDFNNIKKILNGYSKVGIRVTCSSRISDLNMIKCNDKELFKSLPPKLQQYFKPIIYQHKNLIQEKYFEHFYELFNEFNKKDRKITFGPLLV